MSVKADRRPPLRRILLVPLLVAVGMSADAVAQTQQCPHEEGERDRINRTLQAADSCRSAYDLMNACRSNTSGDVALAETVINRCEAEFAAGLTAAQRSAYDREREACRTKYAKHSGTMYVSFAATCEAGVAAKFAAASASRSRGR